MLTGLTFMAHALHGQLAEFAVTAVTIPVWIYPAITLLATMTVLVSAALHAVVLASSASPGLPAPRIRYAYAVSQVARYVPGKIFGVVLETQMLAPAVSLRQVVFATLIQTLLVYAWAAIVAILVLGALVADLAWSLAMVLPLCLVVLWLAHRNRWPQWLGARLLARKRFSDESIVSTVTSRRNARQTSFLLAVQWMPFFLIWVLLAGLSHGIAAAAWLAASYLLASIGGSLLVLIPSGLVIREAAFVWLAGLYGLPASSLVAWALVVRLVLTGADLLAVPLLWAAQRRSHINEANRQQ